MNEDIRRCKGCGIKKPITAFYKNGKRGRRHSCAECIRQRRKTWDKSWQKKPKRIFMEYKRSALKRSLSFEISKVDFVSFENSDCHYCGIKLDQIRLDRVNNDRGYTLNNVVPCCSTCNFLKHTLESEEFLSHISRIYLYQKEKKNGK